MATLRPISTSGFGLGVLGAKATGKAGTTSSGSARPSDRPSLPPGWVRFGMIVDPFDYVDALTTTEPELPTTDSGWDVVARPQQIDATVWRSGKPLRQAVAITFDVLAGAAAGKSVDVIDSWQVLQRLWRPANGAQPPVLAISGPVNRTELNWVIDNVAPDQSTVKRLDGRLVRVEAAVSLMQWVPPDLASPESPSGAGSKTAASPRFERAHQGDTLRIVAKRRLDNGRKWTTLRDLNPQFKTATQEIPQGTLMRLPSG